MGRGFKTVHNLPFGIQVCNRSHVTWITVGKNPRWCLNIYTGAGAWGLELEKL